MVLEIIPYRISILKSWFYSGWFRVPLGEHRTFYSMNFDQTLLILLEKSKAIGPKERYLVTVVKILRYWIILLYFLFHTRYYFKKLWIHVFWIYYKNTDCIKLVLIGMEILFSKCSDFVSGYDSLYNTRTYNIRFITFCNKTNNIEMSVIERILCLD